ncbi:MAG TPA: phosphate signaling complex protein PhoU [Acidimicrobiia bacterium]|nr:phosphate signaling complex protein PhoU [Acidimicrobiia bacterium]
MSDMRSHFHQEMADLEQTLLNVADQAEQMVGMAVDAVTIPNMELAARVVALDNQIDQTYLNVHNRWMALMALQQPMAGDLRMMSVLLHLNTTLERMGDQCVNIAKMAQVTYGLPRSDRIVAQIREMGDLVRPMIRTGIEALVRRDLDEARLLPAMDEPVDRLNRNMYKEVVECGNDPAVLEWATRMMMVSRALERIGDQVVDIAEQTAFLLTGEMMEFDETGIDVR